MIALLLGSFDPPTLDHERAVGALLSYSGIESVWVCPSFGSNADHVRNMCQAFCLGMSAGGKQVAACTVGLDKKINDRLCVAEWISSKFRTYSFRTAYVAPLDVGIDVDGAMCVQIGNACSPVSSGQVAIKLDKFIPVRQDLKESIRAGNDEGRSVPLGVWAYIQNHKLYRDN